MTDAPAEIRLLADQIDAHAARASCRSTPWPSRPGTTRSAPGQLSRSRPQDLRRSNTELEQFAYVASHDLQEPLRKVASFCQLLERRYKGQLDERGDQYIEFAVDGAKRMQQLINDLLAFSRVGRLASGLRPGGPRSGAGPGAAAASRRSLEETGAVVTSDAAADGRAVTSTPARAAAPEPHRQRREVPRRRAAAGAHRRPRGARRRCGSSSCSDNGIGIEAQYADKIFVIFQRLHARDAYAGTGIGLAMCKKIVEYHGGRIWLDTPREQPGTVFRWTPAESQRVRRQPSLARPSHDAEDDDG